MKPTRYKALKTENHFLNMLQSSITISLAVHWVFQGMLYMDRTERLFKLAVDAFIILLFVAVTGLSTNTLVAGFVFAHTLNFMFNGHINGLLKCFGISRASEEKLIRYFDAVSKRMHDEPSIRYAAAFGSLSRGELSDTSDVDIRVIRHPGFVHALQSCTFVFLERSRVLLTGVPLDIYVLDSRTGLSKIRADEPPQIMKQSAPDDDVQ